MRPARTSPEELPGLTIEGVAEIDDRLVLTFTDGTYAAIRSIGGDFQSTPGIDELELNDYALYTKEMLALGICTQAEHDAVAAAWERRRAEQSAVRDREELAQYERLKAKYGV